MKDPLPWQLLADLVLALHVAVVLFVVGGLALILVGNLRGWRGVNRPWFRLLHLLSIGVVVAQAWFGAVCPLTTLESSLRVRARAAPYEAGFVEHWLQRLLYIEAPAWAFTLAYTLFGMAVAAVWWYFPPSFRRDRRATSG
ncbi:MAG: DUF2784 domain-containing protein [Rhizobiales bacterium]|nr:DUF2784 domain-containing protein [Rhizobacter sp.]